MNSLSNRYNSLLILIFSIAPLVAYFTETYLKMGFNRIMQLLSYVGVLLIIFLRDKRYPIRFPKYLFFYFLFILYVFYSDLVRLNRKFEFIYLFSNFLIGGWNMLFIIENINFTKKTYFKIVKISFATVVVAFLAIVIQQIFDSEFLVNPKKIIEGQLLGENINRLYSIFSWIDLLTVGFGFVPLYLITVEILRKNKYVFIWILLGLIYSFLTKARWIMLFTSLVFINLIIYHRFKFIKLLKYVLIIPFIVFFSFLLLENLGVNVKGIVKERILEADKGGISKTSAGTRILAIKALNTFFWENPVYGVGNIKYGMGGTGKQDYKLRSYLKGRSSQIHVGYASLIYMYGFIGAIFFLGFMFLLLKKLYKNSKLTGYWAPFLTFVGFALANLTLVTFEIFEMGLIIALISDKFFVEQNRLSGKSNA